METTHDAQFHSEGLPCLGVRLGSLRIPAELILLSAGLISEATPDAWIMLTEALHAAATEQYVRVLVPAHSAFEIASSHLLKDVFSRCAPKDLVKRFMVDSLTAGGAVNVLLPYVCYMESLPLLRAEIRGQLNRLRKLRNQVVHDGLAAGDVDKDDVLELLTAGVFGFEYVRYLRTKLFLGAG